MSASKAIRQAGLSVAMAVTSAATQASNWGAGEKAVLLFLICLLGGAFVFLAADADNKEPTL